MDSYRVYRKTLNPYRSNKLSVTGMVEKEERPAFARFERRGIEDRKESEVQGRYVAVDVDHALITPPGSRDVYVTTVTDWFADMKRQVRDGRLPAAWYDYYQDSYDRWKKGEELPLNGTPIKTWGVLSPAQQKNLIGISVLTVEDLAQLNDEGMKRIGMGALDLKNKAVAWLRQLNDKGGLTQENAALKAENKVIKDQIALLTQQVESLMNGSRSEPRSHNEPVTRANDLIDEDDVLRNQYIEKFGKAPHHMAKRETILKQLSE